MGVSEHNPPELWLLLNIKWRWPTDTSSRHLGPTNIASFTSTSVFLPSAVEPTRRGLQVAAGSWWTKKPLERQHAGDMRKGEGAISDSVLSYQLPGVITRADLREASRLACWFTFLEHLSHQRRGSHTTVSDIHFTTLCGQLTPDN